MLSLLLKISVVEDVLFRRECGLSVLVPVLLIYVDKIMKLYGDEVLVLQGKHIEIDEFAVLYDAPS